MATLNKNSFPFAEKVICGECTTEITVYDLEGSEFVCCSNCNTYQQFLTNDKLIVKKKFKKPENQSLLQLGAIGALQGDEFKVIASLEKKEAATRYAWREYILYNFSKGYATLVEFDGHWSLIKGENFFPDLNTVTSDEYRTLTYNNTAFRLFNKYEPVVTAMVGEVDWDIVNEKIDAKEYVAAPQMIVEEENENGNLSYYLGEYIEPSIIAAAFGIPLELFPSKTGTGAIQPSKFQQQWNSSFTITGIAVIAVLVIHLLFSFLKPEKELIQEDFPLSSSTPKVINTTTYVPIVINDNTEFKPIVTKSFTIDDQSSNIEFEVRSNVDNNWLEATIILVNEGDNRTWQVSKGVEYYHGYEDGSNWSEGSITSNIMVSDIPQGKYHLNIYPVAGDPNQGLLTITAIANSSMWRNTLITALILCLYPLFCWLMMRNFEKKRWFNSDYSPFPS
jgi:hypothetical protein